MVISIYDNNGLKYYFTPENVTCIQIHPDKEDAIVFVGKNIEIACSNKVAKYVLSVMRTGI